MQDAVVPSAVNQDGIASAAARRPEILPLTSLRCLAALEVVLMHGLFELGGSSVQTLPGAVLALLTQGGAAVSFFFVLSGFILAYTYADDRGIKGTPRRFWRARFARIYPLYVLGFLVDAPRVVSFFVASAASLKVALTKIATAGIAYLALLQSWHPRVTNTWNTPGWSLSTEAFFYAVFPALQVLTRRWSFRFFFGVALASWVAPIVGYLLLAHWRAASVGSPAFQTFWRSFPPLRLPEFALGVATGRLLLSGHLEGRKRLLQRCGALAMFLVVVLICARVVPDAITLSLFAPAFAVVILAVGAGAFRTPSWLSGSVLVLLGRASYAVYILHQPLKTIFLNLAGRVGLASPSPALLISFLIVLQLTCVGLFLSFEDPLRRFLSRESAASGRKPPGA